VDNSSASALRRVGPDLARAAGSRSSASEIQRAFKRVLDVMGASAFLLVFLPLLLGVMALMLILQGRPLFYGHARVGKDGRPFRCFKFRTMAKDGDRALASHLAQNPVARREWETTRKLRDDPRVTPIGRTLRKLSVDELPQFINVLRGEMSLVGPRPIVEAESRHYGPHFDVYCSVRPGITGLWQVSGRSNTSYERRVRLDVDYVDSWSLGKDIVILARTVPAVLSSDGSC
jgi:exopolysaccharide production protein ExoY